MANERDRMPNEPRSGGEGTTGDSSQRRPGEAAEERMGDETGAERMRGTGDDADDDEFEEGDDELEEDEEEEGDGTI